jgi:ADP-ribose pyrophosphatase YjhB (NUDIX family)
MRQATLLFLLKDNQILLAMKKRGFGVGKWNGVGGKQNINETITKTAIRETKEEINVTPKNINQVAILDFSFKNNPDWNQKVYVFTTTKWKGVPTESEEMKPQWFDIDHIPFDNMWSDDPFWLPLVLSNKKIKAKFVFGKNDTILEKQVHEI